MRKPPLAVLILSCILIVSGTAGLAYHLSAFSAKPFQNEMIWISLLRLLAILAGIVMLIGRTWGRWLALAWIVFHVAISFYHSIGQVAMHCLVLALFAYFLFRPEARSYFGSHKEISSTSTGGST